MKWKKTLSVMFTIILSLSLVQSSITFADPTKNVNSMMDGSYNPVTDVSGNPLPELPEIENPVVPPIGEPESGNPIVPPPEEPEVEDPTLPPTDLPQEELIPPFEDASTLADNIELIMYPGESYSFTNNGKVTQTLPINTSSTKGIYFDSATYKADGTLYTAHMDYLYGISITGGYTTIVTASGTSEMKVTIKPDISYAHSSNPALKRETLSYGDNYRFINESTDSQTLLSDAASSKNKIYDYAVYKEDGELSTSDMNSVGNPSIPKGGEIIITGIGAAPVTVGLPYEMFSGKISAEPAYSRVTLNQGESYEFTNISSKADSLESNGTSKDRFDYVIYLADGTESSRGSNTSSKPSIASGKKCVITQVTATPVTYGVPYRTFDARHTGGDAISRITVLPGESIVFYNNGSLTNPIKNDASLFNGKVFDYAIYNMDGSSYSNDFHATVDPSIPSHGYGVFTVSGEIAIIFDYTDDFSVEYSAEPAFHSVTLNKGESVTFINHSEGQEELESNASTLNNLRFDYVTYYPDGTERYTGKASRNNPTVPAGHKSVITGASDEPVTMGALYKLFDVENRSDEAISKITVYPGESVIFYNNGSLYNPIKNDASSSKGMIFDYAIYKMDGTSYSDDFHATVDPSIPSYGYGVFTVSGETPIVFDYTDDFSVEYSAEPAYHSVTLYKGESVTFINHSEGQEELESNATTSNSRRFDYVTYYPDGTERYTGKATYNNPSVSAGHKSVITGASDEPVTMGALYKLFDVENRSNEAISKITVYPGQSVLFRNNGSLSNPIKNDASKVGGIFDYVMYKTDGTVYTDGFNQRSSSPYVPRGGEAVVTVAGDQPIVFDYTDDFSVEESNEPAYIRVILNRGESYSFVNIGSEQEGLDSNASSTQQRLFDVVVYRTDGIIRSNHQAWTTPPVLQPGEKVVFTTASENAVTYGAIYRIFRGEDDSGGHNSVVISPEQSVWFTNTSNQPFQLEKTDGLGNNTDFAVYHADGTLVASGFDTSSVPSVPSGGKAIITNISKKNVTVRFTKIIQSEFVSEPAFHRHILTKGMSYQYTNISSQRIPLNSDADSNNQKLFDYVIYAADGTQRAQEFSTFVEPSVGPGERVVITVVSDYSINFGAVYRLFEVTPVKTPSKKQITINQGQSYVFLNERAENATVESVISPHSNVLFDYALYMITDQPMEAGMDTSAKSVILRTNDSLVVTVTSANPITFEYDRSVIVLLSSKPALVKKTLETNEQIAFRNTTYYQSSVISDATSSKGSFYDFKILDDKNNQLSKGEHAYGAQIIGGNLSIQLFNTSKEVIHFGGPERAFSIENIKILFTDLIDMVEQQVSSQKGQISYYRFQPRSTGTYRFAIKETGEKDTEPQLVLYQDQELTTQLITSTKVEQIYGNDYTTLEWDLVANRYYYLKLTEKDTQAFSAVIKAAKMNKQAKSVYEYGAANRLTKITLSTGDQIHFEYDQNGNLVQRIKNIFPFQKQLTTKIIEE